MTYFLILSFQDTHSVIFHLQNAYDFFPFSDLLSRLELNAHLTSYDIKRLEMYCNNLTDYHLVVDLLPTIARLYFLNKFGEMHLSPLQCVSMHN